jgi:thiamine-monophosphate kinase
MNETGLVAHIRKLAESGPRHAAVIRGIGDDCAILRPRADEDLVFTSDFVLEDRHFRVSTHSPGDIGHKALARSLSDLAAMGGEPLFCLVSLAVPARGAALFVQRFYRGLLRLAAGFRITLAGGDLSRFDKIIADVTCCGRVPRGKALLRSGARPGHRIYVTGHLGESALGFSKMRGKPFQRHLRPTPRVEAGLILRALRAGSCIDLSDGLSLDLARLCTESRVSADLNSNIPIAPGATLDQALHGGDDYELLFTAASRTKIPNKIGPLPVTEIGIIVPPGRRAGQIRFCGAPLKSKGFDHFS